MEKIKKSSVLDYVSGQKVKNISIEEGNKKSKRKTLIIDFYDGARLSVNGKYLLKIDFKNKVITGIFKYKDDNIT